MKRMKKQITTDNKATALVMFSPSDRYWLFKMLKKNFKHCFIAIKSDRDWIIYEPLFGRIEISLIKDANAGYVRRCFETMGCTVVATNLNRTVCCKNQIFSLFTCVKAVKLALGIAPRCVFTPWQLYKYINQTKGD